MEMTQETGAITAMFTHDAAALRDVVEKLPNTDFARLNDGWRSYDLSSLLERPLPSFLEGVRETEIARHDLGHFAIHFYRRSDGGGFLHGQAYFCPDGTLDLQATLRGDRKALLRTVREIVDYLIENAEKLAACFTAKSVSPRSFEELEIRNIDPEKVASQLHTAKLFMEAGASITRFDLRTGLPTELHLTDASLLVDIDPKDPDGYKIGTMSMPRRIRLAHPMTEKDISTAVEGVSLLADCLV